MFHYICKFLPTDENDDVAELPHSIRSPVPKASFLSRLTSKMRSKKHLEKSENKENMAEVKEIMEKEKEKKQSTWSTLMSTKKHKNKDILEVCSMYCRLNLSKSLKE